MSERYWDGGVDVGFDDVNNWSDTDGGATPATSIPGTGDHAHFTVNGDGNACNFESNTALGQLTVEAAYTSKIDLVTYDLTVDDGGDVNLAGAGEFDCGTGDIAASNCNFWCNDQGTFTNNSIASAAITFGGMVDVRGGGFGSPFWIVVISAGATVTGSATGGFVVRSILDIYGELVVTGNLVAIQTDGQLKLRSTGIVSGVGAQGFRIISALSGGGVTVFEAGGSITAILNIINPASGTIMAASTYESPTFKVRNTSATVAIMELSGDYVITGDFQLENTNAGGSIELKNSTSNPSFEIRGDIIRTETAGTCTWTKGTGDITLTGAADQDVDVDTDDVEDFIINKSAGAVVLLSALNTDSFTGTSTGTGDLDPNGQTITIVGNCSWAAAFDFNSAAANMNSCTWVVGGDFLADGQTLNATAGWDLQVTGLAQASGYGSVEYCDGDVAGSTEIRAIGWTDGSNNANWLFTAAISNINIGGVMVDNEHEYIQLLPKQHVEILI